LFLLHHLFFNLYDTWYGESSSSVLADIKSPIQRSVESLYHGLCAGGGRSADDGEYEPGLVSTLWLIEKYFLAFRKGKNLRIFIS
jgi:hypothetical protein